MPKLTPEDWRKLRDEYHVAFTTWPKDVFESLLVKVCMPKISSGSSSSSQGEIDETDALMMRQAHAEPPIVP
ncbi:MAG: hypothetical protein AMJ90_00630 [candidate division Zixibacteria bacterium SM23_73_2]|nr:MAG: hypothetical protein AMJ90_00630 [candidate division Zixibacteria bacterium SM23_73_2]